LCLLLFIYLFTFFLFLLPSTQESWQGNGRGEKVSFRELGSKEKEVALWVRVTKFHKLATTEAFLSPSKQMKIQPPTLF
jgi:hypothetical protein